MDFFYTIPMEKGELLTLYVAHVEPVGRELDEQFIPAPPLDERLKAIVLLRICHPACSRSR